MNKQNRFSWLRSIWLVTLSSLITLAAYIASFLLIMFIVAATEEQQFLRFFLVGIVCMIGYVFLLNHMMHNRDDTADRMEREYRNDIYTDRKDDFCRMLKQEYRVYAVMLIVIFLAHLSGPLTSGPDTSKIIYMPLNIMDSAFGLILPETLAALLSFLFHLFQPPACIALTMHKRKKALETLVRNGQIRTQT